MIYYCPNTYDHPTGHYIVEIDNRFKKSDYGPLESTILWLNENIGRPGEKWSFGHFESSVKIPEGCKKGNLYIFVYTEEDAFKVMQQFGVI